MKLVFLVLVSYFSVAMNLDKAYGEGTGEKLGKKMDSTVEGVSEYSRDQKEKIQKEFKEQLSALDHEIAELKIKARKIKTTANEETKKQVSDQVDFLEKKKAELKSDFKTLQNSTGKAWDRVKGGVQESISALKESFRKAKQEFQSEEKK